MTNRYCDICGKEMHSGYVVHDSEYYCSVDCLTSKYTPRDYYDMYEADEAYWTEWEDESDPHDWIPISEGVPPESVDVELTIENVGERRVIMSRRIDADNRLYWAGYGFNVKVIAWRIPTPYMGE